MDTSSYSFSQRLQQVSLNSDLQQFIETKSKRNINQSPTARRQDSKQRRLNNLSTTTYLGPLSRSLKSIEEVKGLSPRDDNAKKGANPEQNVSSEELQPATIVLVVTHSSHHHFQNMSQTSILSSKKELLLGSMCSPLGDHGGDEHKTSQQLALLGRSATITQDSDAYHYLSRMPDESLDVASKQQRQQPAFFDAQLLHSGSNTSVNSKTQVTNQEQMMRIKVELNRSSELKQTDQTAKPQIKNSNDLRKSPSRQPSKPHEKNKQKKEYRVKVKRKQQPHLSSTRESQVLALQTTTSFATQPVRQVEFHRGTALVSPETVGSVMKQAQASLHVSNRRNEESRNFMTHYNPSTKLTKKLFSQNGSPNMQTQNLRSLGQGPLGGPTIGKDRGFSFGSSGQLIYNADRTSVQQRRQANSLHGSVVRNRVEESVNKLFQKQFNDIFEKLNEQVVIRNSSNRDKDGVFAVAISEESPSPAPESPFFTDRSSRRKQDPDQSPSKHFTNTGVVTLMRTGEHSPVTPWRKAPSLQHSDSPDQKPRLKFDEILENERLKVNASGQVYHSSQRRKKTRGEALADQNRKSAASSKDSVSLKQSGSEFQKSGEPLRDLNARIADPSPLKATLSKTMNPINLNQKSDRTIVLLESPSQKLLTVELSKPANPLSQEAPPVFGPDEKKEGSCSDLTSDFQHKKELPKLNLTSINFKSDKGSELLGWDNPPNQGSGQFQSTIYDGQFNQTAYNSSASKLHSGLNFNEQGQVVMSAIRIEHCPSLKMILTRHPQDSLHIHRNTMRRALETQTISLAVTELGAQTAGQVDSSNDGAAQAVKVRSTLASPQERSEKKSPFQQLTNHQQRQLKLQQKKSLMQLPSLPPQVVDSVRSSIDSVLNATVLQTNASQKEFSTLSPARRTRGGKFVSQSSVVRQKQLLKVHNEKAQARLQQHMQRFERLFNRGHSQVARSLASTSETPFEETMSHLLQKNRLRAGIMKYSPSPSTFVQLPPPSLQSQEKQMSALMSKIAETGYINHQTRSLQWQQQQSLAASRQVDVIQVPQARKDSNY